MKVKMFKNGKIQVQREDGNGMPSSLRDFARLLDQDPDFPHVVSVADEPFRTIGQWAWRDFVLDIDGDDVVYAMQDTDWQDFCEGYCIDFEPNV